MSLQETHAQGWGPSDYLRGIGINNHLPEPGPLQKNETGSEKFQHDVVTEDHFQEDTDTPSKQSNQQQGVDVLVQWRSVMNMVIEEKTCHKPNNNHQDLFSTSESSLLEFPPILLFSIRGSEYLTGKNKSQRQVRFTSWVCEKDVSL